MLSSGFASRTMKSALLPAATIPELMCAAAAESRVAATIASIGVKPIQTQFSNSNCPIQPMKNRVWPVSLPRTIFMPAARNFSALLVPISLRVLRARSTASGVIRASASPQCSWICSGEMVSRSNGSSHTSRPLAAAVTRWPSCVMFCDSMKRLTLLSSTTRT